MNAHDCPQALQGHLKGGFLSRLRLPSATYAASVALAFMLVFAAGQQALASPAPQRLYGSPPVEHFAPDLEVAPGNYCAAQDRVGITYICNIGGILEFDGERWRFTASPNNLLVRSLLLASDGTMLVGGYNAIGLIKRGEDGQARIEDLTARVKKFTGARDFADIWHLVETPEGVYFVALHDVFFWDRGKDEFNHWHRPERFGPLFLHQGKTVLQFRGEGFRERVGEAWVPRSETSPLKELTHVTLPIAGGGRLVGGYGGHWWRWAGAVLEPVQVPSDLPAPLYFLRGIALRDGRLALCGTDGHLYLLDESLESVQAIRVAPMQITNAMHAMDSNLIALTSAGLYRVSVSSPWQVLARVGDAGGSFSKLSEWAGSTYVSSSVGALRATQGAGGVRFTPMEWISQNTHHVISLGGDDGSGRVLVATSHDIGITAGGNTAAVTFAKAVYARRFQHSAYAKDRVYVATENGLRVLNASRSPIPQLTPELPQMRSNLVTRVVERSASEVWAGSARDAVWRFMLSSDGAITEARRFDEKDGLVFGRTRVAHVELRKDGTLVVSTAGGMFVLQGERFAPITLENLSTLRKPGEHFVLARTPDGTEWAYSHSRVFRRDAFDRSSPWRSVDIRSIRHGSIIDHAVLSDGRFALVMTNALLLYQATPARGANTAPVVQLRAIAQLDAEGNRAYLPIGAGRAVTDARRPTIQFEFAVPEFSAAGVKQYQTRLVGYQDSPSMWSVASQVSYSSLPAGDYRFQLRATDSLGNQTQIEDFVLTILPPWHGRWWAQTLFALVLLVALAALVLLLARYRTRLLEAENLKLETKVAARTKELAEANRRLDTMAHVDGLTGIANRRRLDEYLPVVWENCAQNRRSLAVLVIDVDHFKAFNDTRGHLAGDELLKKLAEVLGRGLRRTEDLVARYGGEEFLAVLPSADLAVAGELAESLRRNVENAQLGATISVGVCACIPSENLTSVGDAAAEARSAEDLIAIADAALYRSKREGRNRVTLCGGGAASAPPVSAG